jgi:hypothetical protein
MNFDRRYWEVLRREHHRIGVEDFWRIARKHKDIERLLQALRDEAGPHDSTRARLARVHARAESLEAVALRADYARLEAYFQERRFDRRHWTDLCYYHDRLGRKNFWRLAERHRDIEELRLALRSELRHELLIALEQPMESGMRAPLQGEAGAGLIEIVVPAEDNRRGRATAGSPAKGADRP